MHFSIYNDNQIKTSKFIFENLIKNAHFPSTVRTPPNRFKNYFIGELTHRIKPQFDSIETTSSITLPKNKTLNILKYSSSQKIKVKKYRCNSNNFPILTHKYKHNKSNMSTNTRNIKLVKMNEKYTFDVYLKELNFPYCKPKLFNNPNIINYKKFLIHRNKDLNTIQNHRKKRLFLKSFTKLHLLIDKSKNEKKVNE